MLLVIRSRVGRYIKRNWLKKTDEHQKQHQQQTIAMAIRIKKNWTKKQYLIQIHSVSPSPKSNGLKPFIHPHSHTHNFNLLFFSIRKFATNDCNAQMHKDWNQLYVHTHWTNATCNRTYICSHSRSRIRIRKSILANDIRVYATLFMSYKLKPSDIFFIDCINWLKPQICIQFTWLQMSVCVCIRFFFL